MNPIAEESSVKPFSFPGFLEESGLATYGRQQDTEESLVVVGNSTERATPKDASPQSGGSEDTVKRSRLLNEFRLRQQEALSRFKPRTMDPATKRSDRDPLTTRNKQQITNGLLVDTGNAIELENKPAAKVAESDEQNKRKRGFLPRVAKGGPRVSLTNAQRLQTDLQLQSTIPGMPKIIDGITDLLIRTELYIRELQEQFEISDEDIADMDYFLLPPDATLEEWIEWASDVKDKLTEDKFFERMRNTAARFAPRVDETKDYLIAIGEQDLADEVLTRWQGVVASNLFHRYNTELLFTRREFSDKSICEFDGSFRCKGAAGFRCVWKHHRVQPRRSVHDFEELKVMELDHIISIELIGPALFSVAAEQLKTPNLEMIAALVFGRANLRLVYRGGCHQVKTRKVNAKTLEDFIVAEHG